MLNKSYEKFSSDQSTPSSKIRRVWAEKQQHYFQNRNEQKDLIESPYFKAQPRTNHQKVSNKNKFITSLITKLKSVQRPHDKSKGSKQTSKTQSNQLAGQVQKNKFGEFFVNKNQIKLEPKRFSIEIKNNYQAKPPKINFQELQQQNFILKSKMNELIIENEKLKIKINQYIKAEEEIIKKELILKQRELVINENQTFLLSFQSFDMCNQHKNTINKNVEMSFSNINFHNMKEFSFFKVVDEIVYPTQNQELIKAYKEIKQLKLEKLQLQKKCISAMSQYRKNKEDQLENMKKGFASNLNHYKDLLLKLSAKSNQPQIRKYQQDTLQTVILQTSSLDESDLLA